jgi:hypothetical protein
MKFTVFRDVTPFSLVDIYRGLGEICCYHRQCKIVHKYLPEYTASYGGHAVA